MYKLCKKRGLKITTIATFETIEEAREALMKATGSKKRTSLFIQYSMADEIQVQKKSGLDDLLVFENI